MNIYFNIAAGICLLIALWLNFGASNAGDATINAERAKTWAFTAFVILLAGHWS